MNKIQQFKDADGNNIFPLAYAQGGMKMDLLWTNPSSASFAEQTVSINLSNYDLVVIVFALTTNMGANLTVTQAITPIDGLNHSISSKGIRADSGDYYYTRSRSFTPSSTGIAFTKGMVDNSYNNEAAIPYQVYGIKMSYIVPTSVHGLQYVEV